MNSRTRIADDYTFIRTRMEELKSLPEPTEYTEDGAWAQMVYMISINPDHRVQPGWDTTWREISSRVGCKHAYINARTICCWYDISGICAKNKKCQKA